MFSRRMVGLRKSLTIRFDASTRSKLGVCHLQGLARTSVTVDALPFGQIWFRSVIRARRTGVLTDRATGKYLSPVRSETLVHINLPTATKK